MKKPIIFLLLLFLQVMFIVPTAPNSAFATKTNQAEMTSNLEISAKSGILLDAATGTVVFEKDAHKRLPIASMTKIATLSIVFDALNKGIIHESDMVSVTENAASVKGSSAFLDAGSRYKVCDLIKTVIVCSANDSSVALAEHVCGSEDVFVSKMNKLASTLELKDTVFTNCTGLPKEGQYSCAYDIAKIYQTICDNPLYKKYSKIWMEDFIHPSGRKTGLVNTNRLVKTFDGIEGGKTGFTDIARYCLTASARRGSTRFIGVIIGANDSKTRFAEMTKLLNYGFSNFTNKLIINSEIPITTMQVKRSKDTANVYAERDSVKFLSKTDTSSFTTEFKLFEDIKAPLNVGDKVGKLFVFDQNNMVVDEIELIVKDNVEDEKFTGIFRKIAETW